MRLHFFQRMSRLQEARGVQAIRQGLVMMIPILLIGSFTLVLTSLPIPAYQAFLTTAVGNFLLQILTIAYHATFGLLSVYMAFCLGASMQQCFPTGKVQGYSCSLVSLGCFFVMTGILTNDFKVTALGPQGMFMALLAGVFGSGLFLQLRHFFKPLLIVHADGTNTNFRQAMATVVPGAFTMAIFCLGQYLLVTLTSAGTLEELLSGWFILLFEHLHNEFAGGLLFILLSSFLWFFGIHGSDVLEGVAQEFLVPNVAANQAAVAAGAAAPHILTKQFIDVFALIGGCGSALSLLCAILLYSRRRSSIRLSRLATAPILFNINEILIFGFPVVLNPLLFIPFLLTPAVTYILSYGGTLLGLIPPTINAVEWTTPIGLAGYFATGSLSGALFQFVNLGIGILIYRPFIRMADRSYNSFCQKQSDILVDYVKTCQEQGVPCLLTDLNDRRGDFASGIAEDLGEAIDAGITPDLVYMPQCNQKGELRGAEALMRWNHPVLGRLYPPLVIALAKESGHLAALEEALILKAIREITPLREKHGVSFRLCVNLSVSTLRSPGFLTFLREQVGRDKEKNRLICLEITEEETLDSDIGLQERLRQIHELGFWIAIDDFSMGHTSLTYLQHTPIQLVKLDGTLVQNLLHNSRSQEIIRSVQYLSQSLGFQIMAEYVETPEQRDLLRSAGCNLYQGYLYGKPMPPEELDAWLQTEYTYGK